jgi:hypothetical protein
MEFVMLKKLLNSKEDKAIFPIQNVENNSPVSINEVTKRIVKDTEFIENISNLVSRSILDILVKQYNFEPSEKYKQEIEAKKMYINQLDEYLNERKQINKSVENELQQFLNDTTNNINKALEAFSDVIKSRITSAETQYGIDKIKQTLLDNGS